MRRHGKHDDESVNHERWLITYSDLITLLLIFFIILFSMSQINRLKFQQLVATLSQTFATSKIALNSGNTGLIQQSDRANQSSTPTPSQIVKQEQQIVNASLTDTKQLDNLYQEVQQYIQKNNLQNDLSVTNEVRGVQITMNDVALFSTGSDTLKPPAKQLIQGLVPFFRKVTNDIDVEGYTDNQPIHTTQFPSNWELSADRAMSVVHFLIANNIAPNRLAGIGYGQYQPVAPNNSPSNMQKNRRVNIVVLRKIENFQLQSTSAGVSNSASVNSNISVP